MAKIPVRLLAALVVGVLMLGYYIDWWFVLERYASPWLEILLALTLAFVGAQFIGSSQL